MSLGVRNVDDGDIDKMMAEAPGALDFTTFLNMLAEKLHGTDSEDVILEGMSYLNSFQLGHVHNQKTGAYFIIVFSVQGPRSRRPGQNPQQGSSRCSYLRGLPIQQGGGWCPYGVRPRRCLRLLGLQGPLLHYHSRSRGRVNFCFEDLLNYSTHLYHVHTAPFVLYYAKVYYTIKLKYFGTLYYYPYFKGHLA